MKSQGKPQLEVQEALKELKKRKKLLENKVQQSELANEFSYEYGRLYYKGVVNGVHYCVWIAIIHFYFRKRSLFFPMRYLTDQL